ncbi:hypothetical protein F4808DRAFT_110807 [Astrocystis sublimbata]|nr:hypothetical protein F4808DRAFT_110807 [Astrocystis sublimbata]
MSWLLFNTMSHQSFFLLVCWCETGNGRPHGQTFRPPDVQRKPKTPGHHTFPVGPGPVRSRQGEHGSSAWTCQSVTEKTPN